MHRKITDIIRDIFYIHFLPLRGDARRAEGCRVAGALAPASRRAGAKQARAQKLIGEGNTRLQLIEQQTPQDLKRSFLYQTPQSSFGSQLPFKGALFLHRLTASFFQTFLNCFVNFTAYSIKNHHHIMP